VPAAIEFQREHDWDQERRRCHDLARKTRDRICELTGLAPTADEDTFAQMVAVPLPRCDAEALKATLLDRFRIEAPITSHDGHHLLRLSFQAYNSQADADAVVSALGALLAEPGSPFR